MFWTVWNSTQISHQVITITIVTGNAPGWPTIKSDELPRWESPTCCRLLLVSVSAEIQLRPEHFRETALFIISKMSPLCDCCGEKLNQQVSVMRKEIKNLRYDDFICCSGLMIKSFNNSLTCSCRFFYLRLKTCFTCFWLLWARFTRQMLDGALRAHRKHMNSLQSAVSQIGGKDQAPPPPPPPPQDALERGKYSNIMQKFS